MSKLFISRRAEKKIIHCEKSGLLLKKLTDSDISDLTSLIITGELDKNDFGTIRKMMKLQNLDLSGVQIIDSKNEKTEHLPKGALADIRVLENVILPRSISVIDDLAFHKCYQLKRITIPPSVTHIGFSAFYNCSCLENVVLPENLKNLGHWSFYGCQNLKSIVSHSKSVIHLGSESFVFYGVPYQKCILTVPNGSVKHYSEANVWRNFQNITIFEQ
ncbi:MAG: leucine-rich repeat domain-containing protein [Bacteroidales bacterium]|nr:leucine-rich repeat domain-containing protein [Bacteroidales bacterium]